MIANRLGWLLVYWVTAISVVSCQSAAVPSARLTPIPIATARATASDDNVPADTRRRPAPTFLPSDFEGSVDVDGGRRFYALHRSQLINRQEPVPLVILLDESGGNASPITLATQMNGVADEKKFMIVYPEGTGEPQTWNAGACCGYAMQNHVDDVGFIRKLVEQVGTTYKTDRQRIYATGYGEGGMMVYRLAQELPDTFAAVATVATTMSEQFTQPAQSISVLAINGNADGVVNYERATEAIAFWVRADGCSTVAQRQESNSVTQETYRACKNNSEVVFYTLKGGGHAWPRTVEVPGAQGSAPSKVSTGDLVWQFFARHSR